MELISVERSYSEQVSPDDSDVIENSIPNLYASKNSVNLDDDSATSHTASAAKYISTFNSNHDLYLSTLGKTSSCRYGIQTKSFACLLCSQA
jgi:hypothetical protein